jgi:hypothetical protein
LTEKEGKVLFTNMYTLNVVCNKDSTIISTDPASTFIKYVDTSVDTTITGTLGTYAEASIMFDFP